MRFLKRKKEPSLSTVDYYRSLGCKIGENVDIIDSQIDKNHAFLVSIGNNVTITGVTILAHDASTKKFIGYTKVGKVTIGNNVFIGYNTTILPGTKIGNNVIIGAGTVVAHDIEDNSVICGNPCKRLYSFDEYIESNKTELCKGKRYDYYFTEVTKEEKKRIAEDLKDSIGYEL